MSDFHDAAKGDLSAAEFEAVLRQVGAERYHNRHPYHHRMVAGAMSRGELQAWALNRYCYQSVIPRKDAIIWFCCRSRASRWSLAPSFSFAAATATTRSRTIRSSVA